MKLRDDFMLRHQDFFDLLFDLNLCHGHCRDASDHPSLNGLQVPFVSSKGIHNLPSKEFEKGTGMKRSVFMWIQFQYRLPLPNNSLVFNHIKQPAKLSS